MLVLVFGSEFKTFWRGYMRQKCFFQLSIFINKQMYHEIRLLFIAYLFSCYRLLQVCLFIQLHAFDSKNVS